MKRSNPSYNHRELEDILASEVKEKQELVSALSKEKHTLTKKLRVILKEIKKDKSKIKDKMNSETMAGDPLLDPLLKSGENSLIKTDSFPRNIQVTNSIPEVIKELKQEVPKEDEELEIGQVFDQYEQRLAVLKKDKKFYDIQYKKLSQKVDSLKSQLYESLQEASQCI
jgi:hypothetical protein